MQIGEFAKLCNTKISVLRHYDKEGLLVPDYIDRFTGYRYYAKEQIAVFMRITALKKAGFSLAEIKNVLANCHSDNDVIALFEKKKMELQEMLQSLEEAKKVMNDIALGCNVVKLKDTAEFPHENLDLPFENDESIVGKWEIVGEYAVKEDFYADILANQWEEVKNIYFLPGGQRYWCYGWTKGKLLIETGDSSTVNDFTTELYDDNRYMFVNLKSYHYRHGGKPTVLVLRQVDNVAYSAEGLARKDNIDMPFVDDASVLGKWKAVGYCRTKEAFTPAACQEKDWYFSKIEFQPDGEVISHYDYGNDVIRGKNMQTWTRGYILRKWNQSACAYELRTVNGVEYLLVEWKSGDYRWGGFDTDYYVFVRE